LAALILTQLRFAIKRRNGIPTTVNKREAKDHVDDVQPAVRFRAAPRVYCCRECRIKGSPDPSLPPLQSGWNSAQDRQCPDAPSVIPRDPCCGIRLFQSHDLRHHQRDKGGHEPERRGNSANRHSRRLTRLVGCGASPARRSDVKFVLDRVARPPVFPRWGL
jgi:hypothetical protein